MTGDSANHSIHHRLRPKSLCFCSFYVHVPQCLSPGVSRVNLFVYGIVTLASEIFNETFPHTTLFLCFSYPINPLVRIAHTVHFPRSVIHPPDQSESELMVRSLPPPTAPALVGFLLRSPSGGEQWMRCACSTPSFSSLRRICQAEEKLLAFTDLFVLGLNRWSPFWGDSWVSLLMEYTCRDRV